MVHDMQVPTYFKSMDSHRHRTAELLIEILMTSARFAAAEIMIRDGIVIGCERGVFNRAISMMSTRSSIVSWIMDDFRATYCNVRRHLCERLTPIGTNLALEDCVMQKEIPWDELCSCPIYRIHPDIYNGRAQRIIDRAATEVKKTYDGGKCRYCGSAKTRKQTNQVCRPDESATLFIICDACNMRAKG